MPKNALDEISAGAGRWNKGGCENMAFASSVQSIFLLRFFSVSFVVKTLIMQRICLFSVLCMRLACSKAWISSEERTASGARIRICGGVANKGA